MLGTALVMRMTRLRYGNMAAVSAACGEVAWACGLLLQIPALVSVTRVYLCYTPTSGVHRGVRMASVMEDMQCRETQHWVLGLVCVPLVLCWGVALPLLLARKVEAHLLFRHSEPHKHERYMRWKEAEYAFDISSEWRREHYWLFSSFKRKWGAPFYHTIWQLLIALQLLLLVMTNDTPSTHAALTSMVLVVWAAWVWMVRPFRCGSTNMVVMLLSIGTSFATTYSTVRANGTVNALTIASGFTPLMQTVHILVIVVLACALALFCAPRFGWPRGMVGAAEWRLFTADEPQAAEQVEPGAHARGSRGAGGLRTLRGAAKVAPTSAASTIQLHASRGVRGSTVAPAPESAASRNGSGSFIEGDQDEHGDPPSELVDTAAAAPVVPGIDASNAHRSVDESDDELDALLTARACDDDWAALGGKPSAGADRSVSTVVQRRPGTPVGPAGSGSSMDGTPMPGRAPRLSAVSAGRAQERQLNVRVRSEELGRGRYRSSRRGVCGWIETLYMRVGEMLGLAVEVGNVSAYTGRAEYVCCPWCNSRTRRTQRGRTGDVCARSYLTLGSRTKPLAAWFSVLPGFDASQTVRVSMLEENQLLTPDDVALLETQWVAQIQDARDMLRRLLRRPRELIPVHLVRQRALELRDSWNLARKTRHVLAWSLRDVMDELADVIEMAAPVTVFPNPELEAAMDFLAERCKQRDRVLALCSMKMRHIFIKVLALKCWMGERNILQQFPPEVYARSTHGAGPGSLWKRGLSALRGSKRSRSPRAGSGNAALDTPRALLSSARASARAQLTARGTRDVAPDLVAQIQAASQSRALLVGFTRKVLALAAVEAGDHRLPSAMPLQDPRQLAVFAADSVSFCREAAASVVKQTATPVQRAGMSSTNLELLRRRGAAVIGLLVQVSCRWRALLVARERMAGSPFGPESAVRSGKRDYYMTARQTRAAAAEHTVELALEPQLATSARSCNIVEYLPGVPAVYALWRIDIDLATALAAASPVEVQGWYEVLAEVQAAFGVMWKHLQPLLHMQAQRK